MHGTAYATPPTLRPAPNRSCRMLVGMSPRRSPDRPRSRRTGTTALAADETRAACLLALLDGRAWTAGELARYAGIALEGTGRRPLARACLDWTGRHPHLAGVAGAALCRHALTADWCVRIGSERAVKVTPEGERAFTELLGIDPMAMNSLTRSPSAP